MRFRYDPMMAAKPIPPPVEQARILRALADRIERRGESLPPDVLAEISRLADEGASMWSALSEDERKTVDELAAVDLAARAKATGA